MIEIQLSSDTAFQPHPSDVVISTLKFPPEAEAFCDCGCSDCAHAAGAGLTSFRDFLSLYVDELLGGRVGRRYASALEDVAATPALRRKSVA